MRGRRPGASEVGSPSTSQYIWARAGVIYQARYLTGDALFRFTESMALAGYAEMLNDETRVGRYNLDDSGALRDLCNRR